MILDVVVGVAHSGILHTYGVLQTVLSHMNTTREEAQNLFSIWDEFWKDRPGEWEYYSLVKVNFILDRKR